MKRRATTGSGEDAINQSLKDLMATYQNLGTNAFNELLNRMGLRKNMDQLAGILGYRPRSPERMSSDDDSDVPPDWRQSPDHPDDYEDSPPRRQSSRRNSRSYSSQSDEEYESPPPRRINRRSQKSRPAELSPTEKVTNSRPVDPSYYWSNLGNIPTLEEMGDTLLDTR